VSDPTLRSATELVGMLRRGETTSAELVEHYLERIGRLDPQVGALLTVDAEGARRAAADSDARRASGAGPLEGLPVTVKDSLCTAGLRTTAGAPELADHVPAEDAVSVARLRAAGAVVLGKTTLPPWASDWLCEGPLHGSTRNPWDLARTPGGSSGGAAASAACGFSGLDLGSDLGGSIRLPASWCGVYGLKPSYGLVPSRGHVPPAPGVLLEPDVGAIGPLARSADDLDLALGVLAGPSAVQARGWRLELPGPRAESLAGYRIGVWLDDPVCPPETAVRDVLATAADALAAAGAQVVDVSGRLGPDLAETYELAQLLIQATLCHYVDDEEFALLEKVAVTTGSGPHERWARNVTARTRDTNRAQERRAQLAQRWAALFEGVDVVLCPSTPTTAPELAGLAGVDPDERRVGVDGPPRAGTDQFAWMQSVGALHLPVVTAPVGRTPRGLPVGAQLVAGLYEDRTAIDVARRMAEVVGGYEPPPLAAG
jgi:amidase